MAALPAIRRLSGDTGNGAVAQLGERVVRNDEVRGSIPLGSTRYHWNRIFQAGLARFPLSAMFDKLIMNGLKIAAVQDAA